MTAQSVDHLANRRLFPLDARFGKPSFGSQWRDGCYEVSCVRSPEVSARRRDPIQAKLTCRFERAEPGAAIRGLPGNEILTAVQPGMLLGSRTTSKALQCVGREQNAANTSGLPVAEAGRLVCEDASAVGLISQL